MLSRAGLGLRAVARPARASLVRSIAIKNVSKDYEQEVLIEQRKHRPVLPHLTIYEPQITAILLSFHRITGVAMGFGFYALTAGYGAALLLQYDILTLALVAGFAGLPVAVQAVAKAAAAYPFVYHFANGIRHLVWDLGVEVTNPGVYRTGYAVLAVTALAGSYLAFLA